MMDTDAKLRPLKPLPNLIFMSQWSIAAADRIMPHAIPEKLRNHP